MSYSNTSNRNASRSLLPFLDIFKSPATTCKYLFQRLFALTTDPASHRFTVCGISASEADVNHAMKHLAKRLKRSERELKRSNSKITRITKQQRRIKSLKSSRDQWRRIAEMQTTRAEAQEAEAEEQTFEVEYSATVTRLRRRVERLEAEVENLHTERNDARTENQHLDDQLQAFQTAQTALEEFRMCPILMNPLVLSPLEDTYACAIARQRALAESAKMDVSRVRKRPVRAQSGFDESDAGRLWWLRTEAPQRGPKRGVTG